MYIIFQIIHIVAEYTHFHVHIILSRTEIESNCRMRDCMSLLGSRTLQIIMQFEHVIMYQSNLHKLSSINFAHSVSRLETLTCSIFHMMKINSLAMSPTLCHIPHMYDQK